MADGARIWHTIGVAADEAEVARRSAYRWVAHGLIPVRQNGTRRYIEVGLLRRFASASRTERAVLAQAARRQATPGGETAIPPSPADEDTIAALAESAACAQELASALMNRVHRIERLLGIAPDAT